MKNKFGICFFVFLLSCAVAAAEVSPTPGWKLLGARWAAQLDQQGQVTAIFDLSYPSLDSSPDTPLGKIPASKLRGRWAADIPWKPGHHPLALPPESFRLSDIDYESATGRSRRAGSPDRSFTTSTSWSPAPRAW